MFFSLNFTFKCYALNHEKSLKHVRFNHETLTIDLIFPLESFKIMIIDIIININQSQSVRLHFHNAKHRNRCSPSKN